MANSGKSSWKKRSLLFCLTEKLHLIEYFDDIQLLIKQKK